MTLMGVPRTPPAVAGRMVFVATFGFGPAAYPLTGPVTGPLWFVQLQTNPASAGPTVALGSIYIGTEDGFVFR